MTQPDVPTPPEPSKVAVQVGAAVVPGPDGRPWVQLQLTLGLTMMAMVIPEDLAAELGPLVAKSLADAAGKARLARGGIIVAGNGQMPASGPVNGGPSAGLPGIGGRR